MGASLLATLACGAWLSAQVAPPPQVPPVYQVVVDVDPVGIDHADLVQADAGAHVLAPAGREVVDDRDVVSGLATLAWIGLRRWRRSSRSRADEPAAVESA